MEKQGQRHLRVVLVPCPFQGHINPMLQLGTILHSNGFSITIVHAQYNSPNPSNHPHFTFLPLPDTSSDHINSSLNLVSLLLELNAIWKSRFQECLSQMTAGQQGLHDQICCIIYDDLMYFSEAAANDLELPSIILRTTSAATFLARNALFQLNAEGLIPCPESTSRDPVPKLHPLRFKDLPFNIFGKLENILTLVDNASNVRTSSAIIWNTIGCLEESLLAEIQQQCQVPIFPIGPMHKIFPASSSSLLEEDTSCMAWLDKQRHNSVVYVSLGSVASLDEKELVEMAWGLSNSRQPFLWVVRPGSIRNSERIEALPEGFKETVGERCYIVKWAPQKEVLAHGAVGGFLSHCGWNSTLESICEGVPMICKPCFGDQRVNAGYVSQVWRVGLELENVLDRGEVDRAVRRLMLDKEGESLRERAKNLKEKFDHCIRESGSSNNSLNELVEIIMSF